MKNREEIEMIFDEVYDGTSLEKYGFVLGYTKAQQDTNESIVSFDRDLIDAIFSDEEIELVRKEIGQVLDSLNFLGYKIIKQK